MRNSMPRRGLHNMQTRTSRKAIASLQSPEMYLKLTSLEIERSRRVMELDNLLERMNKLSVRIQAITDEQDALRLRIDGQTQSVIPSQNTPARQNNNVGFTY